MLPPCSPQHTIPHTDTHTQTLSLSQTHTHSTRKHARTHAHAPRTVLCPPTPTPMASQRRCATPRHGARTAACRTQSGWQGGRAWCQEVGLGGKVAGPGANRPDWVAGGEGGVPALAALHACSCSSYHDGTLDLERTHEAASLTIPERARAPSPTAPTATPEHRQAPSPTRHTHAQACPPPHTHWPHIAPHTAPRRQRVGSVVALGLERAHKIASLFYGAAVALNLDSARMLARLAHMDAPLSDYAAMIGRLRSAAAAAEAAAPSEVRSLCCPRAPAPFLERLLLSSCACCPCAACCCPCAPAALVSAWFLLSYCPTGVIISMGLSLRASCEQMSNSFRCEACATPPPSPPAFALLECGCGISCCWGTPRP